MKKPILLVFLNIIFYQASAQEITWKKLEEGLSLVVFTAPVKSSAGDSKITVLKINPAFFELDLVCF